MVQIHAHPNPPRAPQRKTVKPATTAAAPKLNLDGCAELSLMRMSSSQRIVVERKRTVKPSR